MEPTITNSRRRWVASLAAVAILGVMTVGVILLKDSEKKASASTTPTTSTAAATSTTTPTVSSATTTAEPAPTASSTTYKNGTYTASDTYSSPDGVEQISVTATINNDTITDISADPQPSGRESAQYQELFVQDFKQFVVGQHVDNVFLSRVSGSSLTSRGFNGALDQIRQQAKT